MTVEQAIERKWGQIGERLRTGQFDVMRVARALRDPADPGTVPPKVVINERIVIDAAALHAVLDELASDEPPRRTH